MLFTTLAIAALGASSTLATPLLGALWGGKPDVRTKDGALPHLNSRDVNKVGKAELPTCHRDTLYRLFIAPEHDAAAHAFCSIYIAFSSLVRATVTPTHTAIVNVTGTGAVITPTGASTTSPVNANATAPSETCSYNNATVTSAAGSSSNATTSLLSPLLKRQGPPVAPAEADTYPTLRLSSVCSCLVTPATIVTTLTETAAAEYTTKTHTVQATVEVPPFQNTSALTTASASQTPNGTAATTITISVTPNNTADATATATVSRTRDNTASSAPTTSLPGNNTASATATLSPPLNNTANATSTVSQGQNNTATAGLPASTGTNVSSAPAAYCNQTFVRGNGTFLARYMVRCSYSYSNLNPMRVESRRSYAACVRECDNDSRCYGYSFLLSGDAENCYIYNYYPLPAGHVDNLFNSGSYVVGSNNGMKR